MGTCGRLLFYHCCSSIAFHNVYYAWICFKRNHTDPVLTAKELIYNGISMCVNPDQLARTFGMHRYILLVNSEDPGQILWIRRLVWFFAVVICPNGIILKKYYNAYEISKCCKNCICIVLFICNPQF